MKNIIVCLIFYCKYACTVHTEGIYLLESKLCLSVCLYNPNTLAVHTTRVAQFLNMFQTNKNITMAFIFLLYLNMI